MAPVVKKLPDHLFLLELEQDIVTFKNETAKYQK